MAFAITGTDAATCNSTDEDDTDWGGPTTTVRVQHGRRHDERQAPRDGDVDDNVDEKDDDGKTGSRKRPQVKESGYKRELKFNDVVEESQRDARATSPS